MRQTFPVAASAGSVTVAGTPKTGFAQGMLPAAAISLASVAVAALTRRDALRELSNRNEHEK